VRFDAARFREQFPILGRSVHGHPLAYLDNAASTQKPQAVLDALLRFYSHDYANVHRGVYLLSEAATEALEAARQEIGAFINASGPDEIVFVRGTTEAINLVAHSFGSVRVGSGDEILISAMEHHANLVPWQQLCKRAGASLRVAPLLPSGDLDLDAFAQLLGARTRLVTVCHVSNVLGTVNPIQELCTIAHAKGVPVLIDGAQAVAHLPVDVRKLGCDFYAFSGHKVFGPTGIGVLFGRREYLSEMPPYQFGGEMIGTVGFEETDFREPPYRFEAGTPDIAGAIGLGAAVRFFRAVDPIGRTAHEEVLAASARQALSEVPGLRLIGDPAQRVPILSMVLEGVHSHDLGTVLDRQGVAVRAGHHCAQPLMRLLGLAATTRASFAAYNTEHDVRALVAGINEAIRLLR
jgi:cysteine desulfurase/selenocysteine lyase